MPIQTINPTTGQIVKTYSEMDWPHVERTLASSLSAFNDWRHSSFSDRRQILKKISALLGENKEDYAQLITQEMGKPIRSSRAEIEKCQWVCTYYAEHGEKLLSAQPVETEKSKSYILYKPLGALFAIMPWNYPFWQVFRFAAPNIMAGNVILLRHAPISTGAGLSIEKLCLAAGLPAGVFQTLLIDNDTATKVIEDPRIKGVTLTGSPQTGRIVGSTAARALKKVVLELGGSDPYLVLADADLKLAARVCVASRLNNSGQVCIAAKRIIVVAEVWETFEKLVLEQLKNYKMGDPRQPDVQLGPLARADLRDKVHQQVQACVAKGATVITGGYIPDQPGFYYPPTVLKNIKKDMPAMNEEIFGPVIALIKAQNEAEAISLANDTEYGLSAAVFTQDIARGEDIAANQIHTGSCFVNDLVSSDPRLPFGGINRSGFGRELGEAGIREFTNIKTICIK